MTEDTAVHAAPAYTPDEDIKMHEEGAIALICKPFQSHESGLPEWPKNSADEYARRDDPAERRVIVVLMRNGRGDRPSAIGCLDFCGMSSEVIEEKFRHWADPEAAQGGRPPGEAKIQGGHGNGGKCYMSQMFTEQAYFHTVKNGLGSRYGTVAGSVRFGYFPNRLEGRDFSVADLSNELNRALERFDLTIDDLPEDARTAFASGSGFTLVAGFGARDYGNRIPVAHLVGGLQDHPQMLLTVQLCRVYVMADGAVLEDGKPLQLSEIPPMPEADKPRIVPIPAELKDPSSDRMISTTQKGEYDPGVLTIRTSEKSMRWKQRRNRHVINYAAASGYIGYRPVIDFDVSSSYKDRLYGECKLDALEPYKQNERAALASSPLTKAVEQFISDELEKYAKEFELKDKHQHNRAEKDALSEMNEALDQWKNEVLDEVMTAIWGPGDGANPKPQPRPLPIGTPVRVELSVSHHRAGIGVSLRPTIKFFDADGAQIRAVPYEWESSDTNVALVDEELNIVNTHAEGVTEITVETRDGKMRSNSVRLEVVLIHAISISPDSVTVAVGSRTSLQAVCELASGDTASDVYLMWVEDDSEVARVSAGGMVYGFNLGTTKVYAMDDRCVAARSAAIEVVTAHDGGDGPDRGRGFPKVLISGVDPDPATSEPVILSRDDPPVHQRPQDVDRNLWWINSSAPMARLYLDTDDGFGYESREWRMYHIERFMDVIIQIALTSGPDSEDQMYVGDWIYRWGERSADIQGAAVAGLRSFIDTGDVNEIK